MKNLFNSIIAFFIGFFTKTKKVDLVEIRGAIQEALHDLIFDSGELHETFYNNIKSVLWTYDYHYDWEMKIFSQDNNMIHLGIFLKESKNGEYILNDIFILSSLSDREKAEKILEAEGFNKITRSRSPIVFSGKGLDYYKNGTLFAVVDNSGMFVEWDDSKEHSFILQSYKYNDERKAKSNKSQTKGI